MLRIGNSHDVLLLDLSEDKILKIGTPKEIFEGENRVALTPDSALQLQKLGFECLIESGAGKAAGYSDKIYKEA